MRTRSCKVTRGASSGNLLVQWSGDVSARCTGAEVRVRDVVDINGRIVPGVHERY